MQGRRATLRWMAVVAFAVTACGDADEPDEPAPTPGRMQLTSTAFEHEADIPPRYTCDGDDISPPLAVTGLPPDTTTLALIMEDPDAPDGTWYHWVAYDLPADDEIPEDAGSIGTSGTNSWGRTGYGGPCPPSGTHRYYFTVYAVDTELGLAPGADQARLRDALAGRVLAEATLMGQYGR